MPVPAVFVVLPWVAALAVPALARWRWAQWAVSMGTVVVLAALTLLLPFEFRQTAPGFWQESFTFLGRAFSAEPADQFMLTLLFAPAALVFVAVPFVGATRPFIPTAYAVLGLLAASLFVQPFVFAALFIALAAALLAVMLVDAAQPNPRGSVRLLTLLTLAVPFILLTGWLVDTLEVNPNDPVFIQAATLTLMVGFAVWLGVAPFHSWVPLTAETAPPLVTVFVINSLQPVLVALLLAFVAEYAWLRQNPLLYTGLTAGGAATALVGSAFLLGQTNLSRAMSYALLVDIGAMLLALGLNSQAGLQAALGMLVARSLALAVWGVGASLLRARAGGDTFEQVRGLGQDYPLAGAAVIVGWSSLVGFPLLAGFAPRWVLFEQLSTANLPGAVLVLVGAGALTFMGSRALAALITPADDGEGHFAVNESWPVRVMIGVGVGLLVLVGVFPQLVWPLIQAAAVHLLGGG